MHTNTIYGVENVQLVPAQRSQPPPQPHRYIRDAQRDTNDTSKYPASPLLFGLARQEDWLDLPVLYQTGEEHSTFSQSETAPDACKLKHELVGALSKHIGVLTRTRTNREHRHVVL